MAMTFTGIGISDREDSFIMRQMEPVELCSCFTDCATTFHPVETLSK